MSDLWVSICLLRCPFLLNVFPHNSHLWLNSSLCINICCVRLALPGKGLLHISQTNLLLLLCCILWTFKLVRKRNFLWQISHSKGKFPECIIKWSFKCSFLLKPFLHISQLKGLSGLWTSTCFKRWPSCRNRALQMSHAWGLNPVCIIKCLVKFDFSLNPARNKAKRHGLHQFFKLSQVKPSEIHPIFMVNPYYKVSYRLQAWNFNKNTYYNLPKTLTELFKKNLSWCLWGKI